MSIAIHKVVKRRDLTKRFDPSQLNFTHGVASGDPHPKSVILWTRCSPVYDDDKSNVTVTGTAPLYNHDTEEYVDVSVVPVCVDYKVAKDSAMKNIVSSGQAYTSSDIDYAVKVATLSHGSLDVLALTQIRLKPLVLRHTPSITTSFLCATRATLAQSAELRRHQSQTTRQ